MPSVAHQVEAPPSSGLRLERAALELFLESGYDAVTIEQIARAAGLSSRTFFRHFPSKADLLTASARRRYGAVCDEMARRPRFESTFTALCESFVEGALFDPQEAELAVLQRRLLRTQPGVAERLREGAEPMGDRLTSIVAQRLDLDPRSDITADLVVRLVRSAARSAQEAWLARTASSDLPDERVLIESMREAFALLVGARVLDVVAEHERAPGTGGTRMSDPSLEVQSVSHAGVVVEDIDTVGAFFEEVLGLKRLYRIDVDDKILVGLAVDDMLVELIQYPDDDPMRFRATGTARMHLGFTVRDFDRAVQRACDLGIEFLGEPHAVGPARFCFLRGPEDLVVEIVAYEGGASPRHRALLDGGRNTGPIIRRLTDLPRMHPIPTATRSTDDSDAWFWPRSLSGTTERDPLHRHVRT